MPCFFHSIAHDFGFGNTQGPGLFFQPVIQVVISFEGDGSHTQNGRRHSPIPLRCFLWLESFRPVYLPTKSPARSSRLSDFCPLSSASNAFRTISDFGRLRSRARRFRRSAISPGSFILIVCMYLLVTPNWQFDNTGFTAQNSTVKYDGLKQMKTLLAKARALLYEKDRHEDAVVLARKVLAVDKNNASALFYMAHGLYYAGQYRRSLQYWKRLKRIRPTEPNLHLNMGRATMIWAYLVWRSRISNGNSTSTRSLVRRSIIWEAFITVPIDTNWLRVIWSVAIRKNTPWMQSLTNWHDVILKRGSLKKSKFSMKAGCKHTQMTRGL
jgi:hypothetical protein